MFFHFLISIHFPSCPCARITCISGSTHSLGESVSATGLYSHSPSVISALLVRTLPSINLITAKTVQRMPLKTETLYRKSSWKKRRQTLVYFLVLCSIIKWQILIVSMQLFVPLKYTTWEKDFLGYGFQTAVIALANIINDGSKQHILNRLKLLRLRRWTTCWADCRLPSNLTSNAINKEVCMQDEGLRFHLPDLCWCFCVQEIIIQYSF